MTDPNATEIKWLKKSLDDLNKKFDRGFDSVNASIKEIRDLYLDTFETKKDAKDKYEKLEAQLENKAAKEDVDEIKSTLVWLNRIVIGAVILAILGFVITNT